MKKIIVFCLLSLSLLLFVGCEVNTELEESSTLIVESVPTGATIILDGDSLNVITPATLEIDPGNHYIWIVLDGYIDYFEGFTIADGEIFNIDAVLELSTATLIVESVPSGATIYLDGNPVRVVTPVTIEIDHGNHYISLELDGYIDYFEEFTIAGGEIYYINATLELSTTTLIVESIPTGAAIILDDEPIGIVTPATILIEPGSHQLRLELAGYELYYENFTIEEGETYGIIAVLEISLNSSLSVTTTPPGASVYIDGAYSNYFTPVIITDIQPGYHFVRIHRPGYNEITHYVFIEENVPYYITEALSYPVPPYPVFVISSPYVFQHFNDNVIDVEGYIELDNGQPYTGYTAILSINGIDSEINVYYGSFDATISIASGENELQLRANGPNGDTGVSNIVTVYGDFTAPEIEVVLWWNTPTADLDLHAWNPAGEHCYYGNSIISDGYLDIDDTQGYGPETFVVETVNVGVYEIQVNSYSLDLDLYSDASIQVFFDGVLQQTFGPHHFIVDDYNGTDPAAWWEVCTITVSRGSCVISNDQPTPLVREKIELDKVNLPRK